MRDPFRSSSNAQLFREAQVGLSLIAILLVLFVYVAYYRLSGMGKTIPDHVRNAPIAEPVWPYDQTANLEPQHKPVELKVAPPPQQNAITATNSAEPDGNQISESSPSISSMEPPLRLPRTGANVSILSQSTESTRRVAVTEPESGGVFQGVSEVRGGGLSQENAGGDLEADQFESSAENLSNNFSPSTKINTQSKLAKLPDDPFEMHKDSKVVHSAISRSASKPIEAKVETPSVALAVPKSAVPEQSVVDSKSIRNPAPDRSNDFVNVLRPDNDVSQVERLDENEFKPTEPRLVPPQPKELQSVFEDASEVVTANHLEDSEASTIENRSDRQSTFHVVVEGDSFWSIAQQRYDDGRYFRALFEYNRHRVSGFETLISGTRIQTPPEEELLQRYPDLCTAYSSAPVNDDTPGTFTTSIQDSNRIQSYVTKRGDTLFKIAAEQLGQASRYVEIIEMNRYQLSRGEGHLTALPAGMTLSMPIVE